MKEQCNFKVRSLFFPDTKLFLTCSHQRTKSVSWKKDGWQSWTHVRPKHLKASVCRRGVVTERQRADSPPLHTPMCPSGKLISLHDEWSPGERISMMNGYLSTLYRPTKSCAYLLLWPEAAWIRVGRFFRYGSLRPVHWWNLLITVCFCLSLYLGLTTLVCVLPVWLSCFYTSLDHTSIYVNCSASSNRRRNPFRVYRAKIERLYPRKCWKNNFGDAQCVLCKIEDLEYI